MHLLNVQQGHAAAETRPLQNPPEASGSHLPSEGPGKGVRWATASYTEYTQILTVLKNRKCGSQTQSRT